MNYKRNILLTILTLFLISSCKDDDSNNNQTYLSIDENLKAWLSPFDEVNKEITYVSSANEIATIKVILRNFPTATST